MESRSSKPCAGRAQGQKFGLSKAKAAPSPLFEVETKQLDVPVPDMSPVIGAGARGSTHCPWASPARAGARQHLQGPGRLQPSH